MTSWHITANADDGYWYSANWVPDLAYVLLVHNTVVPHSWFRFGNINIPKDSTILSAKISVQAQATTNAADGVITIQAFAEDDAAAPSSIADYIGRAQTAANVPWTPGAWVLGSWYDSPSLVAVVQEIVNRALWASGNAICFALEQTTIDSATRKDCFSRELADNQDAILTVTWGSPVAAGGGAGGGAMMFFRDELVPALAEKAIKKAAFLCFDMILAALLDED